MRTIMVGFLSGDFAVVPQNQGHAVVRPLQAVDHSGVEQFLKQAHDFLVREFAVFVLDELGGDVAHGSILQAAPARVKGWNTK